MIFGQYVPIIVFKVKQLKRSGDLEKFRSDIGSFKKGKKKKERKRNSNGILWSQVQVVENEEAWEGECGEHNVDRRAKSMCWSCEVVTRLNIDIDSATEALLHMSIYAIK